MSHHSSGGVSLLELSIVLAIMLGGVLMAIPTLVRSREAALLHRSALEIRSRLGQTRALSITTGEACRLRAASPVRYALECQPGWVQIAEWPVSGGVTLTASAAPHFFATGNVVPTATFRLQHPRAGTRQVIVNATGRVRIQ